MRAGLNTRTQERAGLNTSTQDRAGLNMRTRLTAGHRCTHIFVPQGCLSVFFCLCPCCHLSPPVCLSTCLSAGITVSTSQSLFQSCFCPLSGTPETKCLRYQRRSDRQISLIHISADLISTSSFSISSFFFSFHFSSTSSCSSTDVLSVEGVASDGA